MYLSEPKYGTEHPNKYEVGFLNSLNENSLEFVLVIVFSVRRKYKI